MRIKNKNNNNYILNESNLWVRDFTKDNAPYIDINKINNKKDYFLFLKNEIQNNIQRIQWIDYENIYHKNIVIMSDGYDFKNKQKILEELPKDVAIIAVNNALNKYECKNKSINYYVVNNPYDECIKYLPKKGKILPKCIVSNKTNYNFTKNYKGLKYRYLSVDELNYSSNFSKEARWQIDDYRNSICAAIGLAYQFGVEKLTLLCCDDSFESEREGSIKLENNLWTYSQQKIAHDLIDANLYWLKNQKYNEIKIKNCSSGFELKNAEYILLEDIVNFYKE